MNHLELESMDKKDRINKIMKVYDRIQTWIRANAGKVSPSDINVAQAALRELEELTVWVDKQDQSFKRIQMKHWRESVEIMIASSRVAPAT